MRRTIVRGWGFSVVLIALAVLTVAATAADGGEAKVYGQWPFDAAEAMRRQQETAEALGLPVEKTVDLGGGVKLELVLIPAGEFMMGGDESPDEVANKSGDMPEAARKQVAASCKSEHPQHKVRITKPFYMGKYEVTQEQWEQVMGANPARFKGAKNPVEQVSWYKCQAFAEKLNGLVKGTGQFALPTEAEWEYACRAGTATAFHTGATISTDDANYDGNGTYGNGPKGESRRKTAPVGGLGANAFGLYDMHGNVWEWCADGYDEGYYRKSPKDDPAAPKEREGEEDEEDPWLRNIVLRGGSWLNAPRLCRSAHRHWDDPIDENDVTGCRVVVRNLK